MKLATDEEVIEMLRGIKALWDQAGLGYDDSLSERLYNQLVKVIAIGESKPKTNPHRIPTKQEWVNKMCRGCNDTELENLGEDIFKCHRCGAVFGTA